jgi:hypothetical protein
VAESAAGVRLADDALDAALLELGGRAADALAATPQPSAAGDASPV